MLGGRRQGVKPTTIQMGKCRPKQAHNWRSISTVFSLLCNFQQTLHNVSLHTEATLRLPTDTTLVFVSWVSSRFFWRSLPRLIFVLDFFPGRRVLESYLLLFLTSSPALKPTHDMDAIISRTLNTYVLGEHIGSKWGLGRALRWTPTVPAHKLKPNEDQQALLRNVGLYKVQGDAVAAVMGGIFYQFVRPLCLVLLCLPSVSLTHTPGNPGGICGTSGVPHTDTPKYPSWADDGRPA